MSLNPSIFKTDFFNGVFGLVKKTWLRLLYAYLMYYGATIILGGIFVAIAFVSSIDLSFFAELMDNPNPSPEQSLFFIQEFSEIIMVPEFLIPLTILFLILLVLGSWNYYFAFTASNNEVKGDKKTFAETLKQSFSIEVFKLIGISLLLNIIFGVLFFAVIASIQFSGILALLLFLFMWVLIMRFSLVIPAFVVGNYSFSSSFQFSFYHVNWLRALKYFGIAVLFFMILLGVSMIISLLSMAFSFIPFLGIIIQQAINILFGVFMMAIMTAGMVGLFYRYIETPKENTPSAE